MSEAPSRPQLRPVRLNAKPKRQDIYCYDLDLKASQLKSGGLNDPDQSNRPADNRADKSQPADREDQPSSPPEDEEDDEFICKGPKIKKQVKQEKQKVKADGAKQASPTKIAAPGQQGIEEPFEMYMTVPSSLKAIKQVEPLKIFDPIEYQKNQSMKADYQRELEQIYGKYGRRSEKLMPPQTDQGRHNFLLRQVEEAGTQFAIERDERNKLRKKLSRFASNAFNRQESIRDQKVKDQEKKVRKQAFDLVRKVKKDFWCSVVKVRKALVDQESRKCERVSKLKKLEDLVARQFEASKKITTLLEDYQQVELSGVSVDHSTNVPVTLQIETQPTYKCLGLYEDNVIRPSILVKFPLREYQLLGVHWLYTLHNRNMNAILADEMGLGKTIQTISLLAKLAIDKGVWGPHLVVVPTTILMNWEIEFKRWCPAFKIMTYFGNPKERKQKRKGWSRLNTFHVCITSYKIAVTDHPIFRRKKWYYMILDEAQNIKNFKSQRWQVLLNFKTKHRLLLTGTPLQNDLTELWSLLHFLMPHVFNSFDDFNEWFNIPFQEALEKNFPISQEILKKLHTVLRPFFLRRLKKVVQTQLPTKTEKIIRCSMSRRQKYLYDQLIWHENRRNRNSSPHEPAQMMNILMGLKKICNHPDLFQPRIEESPLSWPPFKVVIAHHMFLKAHFLREKQHLLMDFADELVGGFESLTETILGDFANIKLTPDNVEFYRHRYRNKLHYAEINYRRSLRRPFHAYKFDFESMKCAQKQLPIGLFSTLEGRIEQLTPILNRYLFVVPRVMAYPAVLSTFPMNSWVTSQTNELEYLAKKVKAIIPRPLQCLRARFLLHFPNKRVILYDSGKLVKMMFLLRLIKIRGRKALIFTQMTKMLDIFEKVLNIFKFTYVRLDGNTKTQMRQKLVQRFNNDPRILCFISSTRSGGIGLNLTGASNVIFYDTDWNPAMDKQAQDRCHRIGQMRDVTIYRLITEHSVEENILMKSIQKRKLESLVTEDGMFDTSYFEKVSLKGLLEGVIDYNDDKMADLADVEDDEDRQMLHTAEKEVKERKTAEEQELDDTLLPKLFRYGLRMLENAQLDNSIHQQMLDDSEAELQESEMESHSEAEGRNEQVRSKSNRMEAQEDDNEEDPSSSSSEPEQSHSIEEEAPNPFLDSTMETKLSVLERLKAISIYQSHLDYMKQQYYVTEAEPETLGINGKSSEAQTAAKPKKKKKKKR